MKLFRAVGKAKVYFERSRSYVSLFQFLIMVLVTLKVYEDTKLGEWFFSAKWHIAAFLGLFIVLFLVWGWFDRKYIRPHEQLEIAKTDEIKMGTYNNVKKILQKLDEAVQDNTGS